MKDFLKSLRSKILIGILIVMVGFMIMAVYTGGTASLVTQIVTIVVEPVQKLSSNISGRFSDFFDRFLNAGEIMEQNEILRKEISELRGQLVDYERIKHEYDQLQKIGDVREQWQDTVIATAAVIAREPTNPFYAFTIDKGTLDDIKLYDPVMTEDGLVGYISEVGLTVSKVVTILDVNSNVGASNITTRDIGNVTGTVDLAAEGLCSLEYLPRDSETASGHIIVTSGGSLFPKGITIGEVVEVTASSGGNSMQATIRPTAQIESVKDVFVITHFEGQGIE